MSFSRERDKLLGAHGTNDVEWGWKALQDDQDDMDTAETTVPPKQDSLRPSKAEGNKHKQPAKRSSAVLGDVTGNKATKRRKVDPQAAPRRSVDSSLFVLDKDSPDSRAALPKAQVKPAPLNNPFEDSDSDGPADAKTVMPAQKLQSQPKTFGAGLHSTPMDDREKALAQSARLRREAAEKKKARYDQPSARPSPALTAAKRTIEARRRDDSPAVRPHRASQTRPVQGSGQKSQRKAGRPPPQPAPVISLDSDSDDAPASSARPTSRAVAPISKARDAARVRSRPAVASVKQEPQATFKEKLAEVKRERTISPAIPRQPGLQQVIDLTRTTASTGIEKAADRRKRLRDEAAKSAAERLQQERQQAEDRAKALEEQQRRKQEAEAAAKRREDERAREQLAQEAEARRAAIERKRRLDQAKQRQDDADAQQHTLIQEQIRRVREEEKQKKAIEDANRVKQKAEDEAKREAERQRAAQQKRAQLAKRQPVLDEQAQHERNERIRLKKERAARNKKTQEEEDGGELILEDAPDSRTKSMAARAREARATQAPVTTISNDDDDLETSLSTPSVPSKPVSLNSAAGLRAVGSSATPSGKISGNGATQSGRSSHKRALGEILAEDACIVKWRDTESKSWAQIQEKYLGLTGKTRAEKTLKDRFRQVSEALTAANVEPSLRQRLIEGEEEARREVNIAVHGEWPVSRKSSNATPADTGDLHTSHQTTHRHVDHAADGVRTLPTSQPENLLARGTIPPSQLPPPGEILPADALLYRWRKSNMSWPQIVEKYRSTTGVRTYVQLLRDRYGEVEDALESAWLLDDEVEALSLDLPGARAKVNGKVWSTWPPALNLQQRTETPTRRGRGRPPKVPRTDSPLDGPVLLPPLSSTAFPPHIPPDLDADGRAHSPVKSPGTILRQKQQRSTTGGKKPSWDLLQKCIEDVAEACTNRTEDDDYESDVDSADPDDYNYYVYRVLRKDYTLEEEESGVNIEDVPWREVSDFEDLKEANKAADGEVSRSIPGIPAYTEGEFHTNNELQLTEGGGCRRITVVSPGVGQLNIEVAPFLRTVEDDIPPKSKTGWLASTVYSIQKCTFRKTFDAARNVNDIEKNSETLHDTLTSHLGIANERAIGMFVDIARKRNPRLEVDAAERREQVEYMKGELAEHEDGEDAVFDRTHVWSENKSVRIRVVASRMVGPRNHFQFCVGDESEE